MLPRAVGVCGRGLSGRGCGCSGNAPGVTYQGGRGPGAGKHIVFISGDDGEYHSEEALPALAKILAVRHGFTCTVLFSINPHDGTIDPREKRNIPGLEALRTAIWPCCSSLEGPSGRSDEAHS